MLTDLRLADLRLTTAQRRTTGQDLLSDLYVRKVQRPGTSTQVIFFISAVCKLMQKWFLQSDPLLRVSRESRPLRPF
jgi:hypothetical protein